jgi:hypothetical protein
MQLMSGEDVAALIDLLLEDLPVKVLCIVSSGPTIGMTEGEITRAVERRIPRCEDALNLQGRVRATLGWMLAHGDIDSASSYRFVRVPTYAIHYTADNVFAVQLLGDDHLDDEIGRAISLAGCVLRKEVILDSSPDLENDQPFAQGIRRTITALASARDDILTHLKDAGVTHIDISELERNLPGIDGLVMLPNQAYVSHPPSWGVWQRYDARLPVGKRWGQIPSWETAEPGLLRWVQSLDRRGYFYSRYFWHDGQPKLAELSRSFALLWTYRLDRDAGQSAVVYVDGQELWLSLEVPSEHEQWLGLLSTKVGRTYPFTHYTLNRPATIVGEQLQSTLGVSIVAERP